MAQRPIRPPRPFVTSPSVVVCHEEHGEAYFIVNSDEELFRVALSILKGRQKVGYWYGTPTEKPVVDFTEADVEKMPASIQNAARRELRTHADALRHWEETNDGHTDIAQAIDENDGRFAWEILRARSHKGYEYECVSLERVLTAYPGGE